MRRTAGGAGGSSLGAKMGLLRPCGDRDEGRRTHGAPTGTPSPMKALVGSGTSGRCLNVQPGAAWTASPCSSNARLVARCNLLSTRHRCPALLCLGAGAAALRCVASTSGVLRQCQTMRLARADYCRNAWTPVPFMHPHPCQSPVPCCMEIWNPRQISGEAFVHMWKVSRVRALLQQAQLHAMNC